MAPNAPKDFSTLNVLVIDDDEALRLRLSTLLRGLGVRRITEVGDPSEAFLEAKRRHPNVIFCRYDMEPVGGVEFAEMVRNSTESPDLFVPVVMLVDRAKSKEVAAAKASGVDEILALPLSASALNTHLTKLFNHQRVFVQVGDYFGLESAENDGHKSTVS